MSRLEQSQKRLAEAVQRLEAALAEGGAAQDAGAAREIAAVRSAYLELQQTADAVADRLDRAIARVDHLLGDMESRNAAE
ncbi:MAG: hypothetical protein ACFCVH_10930 [Alphaproteobacteria bacterium]